jgi:hypothetical protein
MDGCKVVYDHAQMWLRRDRSDEDCKCEWVDAAKEGDLHKIIQLHLQRAGLTRTRWAMDWAAYRGHLAVVIWLRKNRSGVCSIEALNLAAENGHLDIVIWSYETFKPWISISLHPYVDVVERLKDHAVELGYPGWLDEQQE